MYKLQFRVPQKFDHNTHNFHLYYSLKVGVPKWTDQPASFPEVTNETRVQREGQLIALAQLWAFVAVA